jgi:hypothetical protein
MTVGIRQLWGRQNNEVPSTQRVVSQAGSFLDQATSDSSILVALD